MIFFLWFCLPALVSGQCISKDDKKATNDPVARAAMFRGQQLFSLNALKIYNDLYKEQNIFFSPHSMYQSLLLTYFTAANETEAAIQQALHLPESQNKLTTVHNYGLEKSIQNTREINGSSDYEFKTCNRIFLSNKVNARACMVAILNNEVKVMDFSDRELARHTINSWVEESTKNHIKELLSSEAVQENTKMILANAAYFKGLWKSRFLLENTKKNSLFYVKSNDIKIVDMMVQKGVFHHMISEKLKVHILELPYKGNEVSMIILLPRFEDNSVDKVIKQLSEESLQDIINFDYVYPRQVEVEIPKFTVEQTADLRPIFEKLGLTEIFSRSANFSTLAGEENIYFNDAIHKAKVEVNEEGTVAAAATAVFTFRSSRPLEPTKFTANHPFIYFIYDKVSQNILFAGVFRVPDKKYHYGKKIRA